MIDARVLEIARAVGGAGGRALLVGGYVRDHLLGFESKDFDLEVFGLSIETLEKALTGFGEIVAVGRSFGVLRVKGIDCDISIPRRESKTGRGHRGFLVEPDPSLDFAEAARRRDLTVNSMGLDPLSGDILDPHGGRRDLERRVLRATDASRFGEDPLRALRVAQFASRFEMVPDSELKRLCAALDLSELPGERCLEEFRKLVLKGVRPSVGLDFLRETRLLRFFPELERMVGVPQDPVWHPEGTVWEHTLLVVDEAARERSGTAEEDLPVLFAALCHDLGKPFVTIRDGDRLRSPGHEEAGVEPTERFLGRLRAPQELVTQVVALVRYHLTPANFVSQAKPKAYRRLARRLQKARVTFQMLWRVACADHMGRTTPDALARSFPAGEEFLRQAALAIEDEEVKDVVMGRHLIARGLTPGPRFGEILARCREVQDDTGWRNPQRILDRVLSGSPVDRGGGSQGDD